LKIFPRNRRARTSSEQVQTKQSPAQKQHCFCVDRAAEPKPHSPCWENPPEEPREPFEELRTLTAHSQAKTANASNLHGQGMAPATSLFGAPIARLVLK
jgi:hypothetical protein